MEVRREKKGWRKTKGRTRKKNNAQIIASFQMFS